VVEWKGKNLDKSLVVALTGIISNSNDPDETSASYSIPLPLRVFEAIQSQFHNKGSIQPNDNNNSNHNKAKQSP